MKTALLVIALAACVGCSKVPPQLIVNHDPQHISFVDNLFVGKVQNEAEWASKLRKLAAEKHLRWQVFCNESAIEPDSYYIAYAEPEASPITAHTAEDGELPWWQTSARSQEIAGRKLLLLLNGPPNEQPQHKTPERAHRQCKPSVRGGKDFNEKYAEDKP